MHECAGFIVPTHSRCWDDALHPVRLVATRAQTDRVPMYARVNQKKNWRVVILKLILSQQGIASVQSRN